MGKHVLNVKVAVLAYFEKDGRILLQKRKNSGWRDGWYGLVAGHVENDEPYKSALRREVKEEVGVDVREEDLEFAHLLLLPAKLSDCQRLYVYFRVTKWEGEPSNAEPERCDDVRWFDKSSLPENLIPVVKFGMEKMTAGEMYSEFGWEPGYKEKL
ncbi:MAG: hypothetical protein KatS3mg101_0768 [Patescibacteria group bacterium]|nr:MAG: hypothetical protein KatS3mg101_0768 [Patescibacteria group bacterium]